MLCNCFRRFISFHSQVANLTSIPRPLASPSLPLPVSCSPPPSMAPSWPLPSIPQTLQCPSRRVACPKLTGNFCFRWELARMHLLIVERNLFFIASESFVKPNQVCYRASVLDGNFIPPSHSFFPEPCASQGTQYELLANAPIQIPIA